MIVCSRNVILNYCSSLRNTFKTCYSLFIWMPIRANENLKIYSRKTRFFPYSKQKTKLHFSLYLTVQEIPVSSVKHCVYYVGRSLCQVKITNEAKINMSPANQNYVRVAYQFYVALLKAKVFQIFIVIICATNVNFYKCHRCCQPEMLYIDTKNRYRTKQENVNELH